MPDALTVWLRARGGVFDDEGPVHFGDPRGEYEAARSGAGLLPRSKEGRLFLTGADRLDLLHRTTTGDLRNLAPGRATGTVIQTETARILDHLTLLAFADHLVAVTGPGRAEVDAAWIDRMTIMDDVHVRDVTGETELFDIAGTGAAAAVEMLVEGAGGLEVGAHRSAGENEAITVARTGAFTFLVMMSSDRVVAGVEQLVRHGGVTPVGRQASEAVRIERGIPVVGRELTEAANPLEAGLLDSIGFEKGCYTGQEVIARMITYKSVKRMLCGFRLTTEIVSPEWGGAFGVEKNGVAIGRLTSAAFSWDPDGWIGLGYLKTENAPERSGGTDVIVQAPSGPVRAVTALLPLRS